MAKSVYGPGYRAARAKAFERAKGECQYCGDAKAVEAHHRGFHQYPSDDEVNANDLIALCNLCHGVATNMRRQLRRGSSRFEIASKTNRSIASCSTQSESPGLTVSSYITEHPALTADQLSAVRLHRSQPSAAGIAPKPTKIDSANLNVNGVSGLTKAERLQYQLQLSEPASKAEPKNAGKDRKLGAGWWC